MKNLVIYIIGIVLIVLLFVGYMNLQKKFNLYQSNQEQLLNKVPDKSLFLIKQDFKEYQKQLNDSLFKKITDSLNIRFKNITRTINHKYSYSYDSTFTVLIKHQNSKEWHFNKEFDNCLSLSGRIKDTLIFFDEVIIDYEAQTIYYFKRKKILGFLPFGRKQFHAITENNCTGQTTTQEINIIKHK